MSSIDDEKLKDFIEEVFSSEGYTVNDLNFQYNMVIQIDNEQYTRQ